MADDGVQQLVQGGGDADGWVFPENVPDAEPLQLFDGAWARGVLVGEEPPEKIPLADGAYVPAFAVDDRHGTAAMVPELFQALAHRAVVVEESHTVLRRQEISNIHNNASFLAGGSAWNVVDALIIIYRKRPVK